MRTILCLAVLLLSAWAQRFPMKYLGELGHLRAGQRIGPARAVEEGVVRLEGKGWSATIGVTGGVGWTELYTADFDADGQADFLFGEHFPGCGQCIDYTTVTVLLFDKAGRPTPWMFGTYLPRGPGFESPGLPYLPVLAMDADRDGRAEFVVTDCKRHQESGISGVYEARDGRLALRRDEVLMSAYRRVTGLPDIRPWSAEALLPGYGDGMDGPIEELWGHGIGVEGGEGIRIAGVTGNGWPAKVIADGPNKRTISMDGGWDAVLDAMRNGFSVKRFGDSGWLAVDGSTVVDRANVGVSLDVAGVSRAPLKVVPADGGCMLILHGDSSLMRCKNAWTRSSGGKLEEFLPDGLTIRTSHTAMQRTVIFETRYARPPGATRMTGMAEVGDFELTQWGPKFFALHSSRGELIASRVRLDVDGVLAFTHAGIVLLQGNELVTLRGRLRWRRE